MEYTPAQAAKRTGRSKSTILRAIKAGKLTPGRDPATGGFVVEASELMRVFGPDAGDDAPANGHDAADAREAELLRRLLDEKDERIAELQADKEDLRRRLDQVTALLPAPRRRWWWRR